MLRWVARSSTRHASSYALAPTVKETLEVQDGDVTVNGHIRTVKTLKNHAFIDVTDGTSPQTLNVLLDQSLAAEKKLRVGQSIALVAGVRRLAVKATEFFCDPSRNALHRLEVVGAVPERYPIQKKATSMDFLRTLPTLRHRTATLASIARMRSHVEAALMSFYSAEQFTKVAPPILTSSDCEGAGELFYVAPVGGKSRFFKRNAYLTVSTQLHLELLAPSLGRVWTLTPCFRAENSDTNRHLSEFWMLEAEISYVRDVRQLTHFAQRMLEAVVSNTAGLNDLKASYRDEAQRLLVQQRWNSLQTQGDWPTITYGEALDIINEHANANLSWGSSLSTEHEKWLARYFEGPVFVTDYPKFQKPFYMSHSINYNEEKPTVACFDLIVPEIGELIGGSMRIHSHAQLMAEIEAHKMDGAALEWYTLLRQNGTVPHGGFGMGFERLLMYLSGQNNIRDVIAFPRYPGLCQC